MDEDSVLERFRDLGPFILLWWGVDPVMKSLVLSRWWFWWLAGLLLLDGLCVRGLDSFECRVAAVTSADFECRDRFDSITWWFLGWWWFELLWWTWCLESGAAAYWCCLLLNKCRLVGACVTTSGSSSVVDFRTTFSGFLCLSLFWFSSIVSDELFRSVFRAFLSADERRGCWDECLALLLLWLRPPGFDLLLARDSFDLGADEPTTVVVTVPLWLCWWWCRKWGWGMWGSLWWKNYSKKISLTEVYIQIYMA